MLSASLVRLGGFSNSWWCCFLLSPPPYSLTPTVLIHLTDLEGQGLGCPRQHTSKATRPPGWAVPLEVKERDMPSPGIQPSTLPSPRALPLPHVVMFLDVNLMEHHILLFGVDVGFHLHGT